MSLLNDMNDLLLERETCGTGMDFGEAWVAAAPKLGTLICRSWLWRLVRTKRDPAVILATNPLRTHPLGPPPASRYEPNPDDDGISATG